jgi:signal transduction histidine kinase
MREWFIHLDDEDPRWPANHWSIERWMALGALRDPGGHLTIEVDVAQFDVTDVGHELFRELADVDNDTSFRILARAFLEDEREQMLAPLVGADRDQDRATAATLRHARMVAHEVRNTLLPIQFALAQLWDDGATSKDALAEPRRVIEAGLARLHRFVDESLRLTPITPDEALPFFLMEAIEEARQRCDPTPAGGVLIETRPGSANPRCRGHRGRFVLALLNLLRNAVQVGGVGVRVEIGVDARTPGRVVVTVQDDGPGITDAQRASLFQNGVSYRDGGTGYGLSLVRVVVEEEMGGTVRLLSPEDPGGACFQLEIPAEQGETAP